MGDLGDAKKTASHRACPANSPAPPPTTTDSQYSQYLYPQFPHKMAEQSIRSLFTSAERQRQEIESSWDSNTAAYQQNVAAAIATYDDCLKLADRLSLFSPNETLEDVSSIDLQYIYPPPYVMRAVLTAKIPPPQLSPRRTDPPSLQPRAQDRPSKSPRGTRALPLPPRPLRDPLTGRQEAVRAIQRIPHYLLYDRQYRYERETGREDSEFQARTAAEEEVGGMLIQY